MKIAITGGHLTPALAVISELHKRGINQLFYVGRSRTLEGDTTPSAESIIIPNLQVKFYSIPVGRLQRKFTRYTIPSLLRVPFGIFKSLLILSQEKPDLIISFGSHVALPVVIAGWVLGIPTITHEQTVKAGLSNKIISKFAKKIAISWPESEKYFPKNKTVMTGNPIRPEILNLTRKRTVRPMIFITGGNQGAHAINEAVLEIIDQLLEKYEVVHQTGGSEKYRDFEMISARVSQLPPKLIKRYQASKWYNSSEQSDIYSSISLLVGRSGANTVSEAAALGIPAIFIPLPWSGGNEQEKNAKMLENIGAAVVLSQERLTPKRLLAAINNILLKYNTFRKNAKAAKKLIISGATKILVDEALDIIKER